MTSVYRTLTVSGRTFEVTDTVTDLRAVAFIAKIDFDSDAKTGCWRWAGAKDYQTGYGQFHVGREEGVQRRARAHRFAWRMLRGYIAEDIHLHHKIEAPTFCIGPNCVNPEHLLPVSAEEHVDLNPVNITVINRSKTHCAAGHELTPENSYTPPGTGKRRCRECMREWGRQQFQIKYKAHPRDKPTHCPKGHPYDAENGYEYKGRTMCRACHAELTKRQYHEKKGVRGIHSGPRVLFEDRKTCKNAGHDLTLPDAIYRFTLHGQPKACCRLCKEEAGHATYEKWKLAHANDPKPPRRKPGPKPRYNDRIVSESDLGPFATGGPVF